MDGKSPWRKMGEPRAEASKKLTVVQFELRKEVKVHIPEGVIRDAKLVPTVPDIRILIESEFGAPSGWHEFCTFHQNGVPIPGGYVFRATASDTSYSVMYALYEINGISTPGGALR